MIFCLWVKIIIIKKVKNKKSGFIWSDKNENIKTLKAPIIDDKDEYLVKNKIIIQEIPKIKPKLREKASIIPRYVATPFPPLNFNQIGNIWPRKQIKADE